MKQLNINYYHGNLNLKGFVAYHESSKPKPAILISHDWSGQTEFTRQKAQKLAELGYVGFAIDMYGDGKTGQTNEEKSALMTPILENRPLLQERILAAYHAAQELECVDANQIAAIGFCFGGLCVLDLARSGIDIKGVVSFHGNLTPSTTAKKTISSKILALHGYDDPLVTAETVRAFANEMTEAQADWQIHMYGHTVHAFTNPHANDANFGTVYNATADHRSFIAMKNFLEELFS